MNNLIKNRVAKDEKKHSRKVQTPKQFSRKLRRLTVDFVMITLVFAFVGIVSGLFAKPAAALDPGTSITISPLIDRVNIAAGQTTDGTFTITNNGSVDYIFDVYARPYTVANDTYVQTFTNDNAPRAQVYRWITFDQNSYELKSGQHVEVAYHINAPASIPAGSQYAVIFAQTRQPSATNQSGVQASQRVGILIYAHGNGKTVNQGSVISSTLGENQTKDGTSSVTKKSGLWYQAPPVYELTRVKNGGNTDFDLTTHATLTNFFGGGKVATSIEQTHSILPGTTYQATDKIGCSDGDRSETTSAGAATCVEAPWIGLFWLTTSANFLGKTYTFKHLVLVLPWWLVAIVIAVIVIIILSIWLHRRLQHHENKRAGRSRANGSLKI